MSREINWNAIRRAVRIPERRELARGWLIGMRAKRDEAAAEASRMRLALTQIFDVRQKAEALELLAKAQKHHRDFAADVLRLEMLLRDTDQNILA